MINISEGLTVTRKLPGIGLYPYQLDAVNRMKNGCILCGGVGSGKSRTALGYYYLNNGGLYSSLDGSSEYVPMADPPKDLYIITTARKRDTLEWETDMNPFLISVYEDVHIYQSKVVVDSWNNIVKYVDVKDSFFIFDEQRVIGSGVWVKTFLKIVKSNEWILLSATPGDTWQDYIPVFLANGFYKNKTSFVREHIRYSRYTKYPKIEGYMNTKKLEYFKSQILVDMDFERETEAHHSDIFTLYDQSVYREVTRFRWDPFKNEPIRNAAALCYIWRKITNASEDRQAKLLELYEKHPRVIIFYNFDYELDILRSLPYGSDEVAEWNGHRHDPLPKGNTWVYLVQYAAGSEGWNCTTTDTIIFYSQSYSYKAMIQAAGRIDRLNTPFKDLYYYHLKSKAPIDLGIARALKQKKNFNERTFVKWD